MTSIGMPPDIRFRGRSRRGERRRDGGCAPIYSPRFLDRDLLLLHLLLREACVSLCRGVWNAIGSVPDNRRLPRAIGTWRLLGLGSEKFRVILLGLSFDQQWRRRADP